MIGPLRAAAVAADRQWRSAPTRENAAIAEAAYRAAARAATDAAEIAGLRAMADDHGLVAAGGF